MENVLAGRERAAADRVPPSKEAYLRRTQSHKVCILSAGTGQDPGLFEQVLEVVEDAGSSVANTSVAIANATKTSMGNVFAGLTTPVTAASR